MQRYCFTDCFKRNISRKKRAVIEFLTFLLFATILFIIGSIIALLLGIATQLITVWLDPTSAIFALNPFMVGLGTAIILLFIGVGLMLIGTFLETSYKVTRNLVTNVVAPEEAECRIFEPCKEQ